ncbi:MAG: ABC-type transport auxiliary lipoprotein family protein [Bordetella sp.]|uniref:ABC-type transport auxiliary lipoprotein family protein n=1 Tax=Bordetella sp. TaxID=28081 RepID=UPI003F7CA423
MKRSIQNRMTWMVALCLALALAGCSLGKMEPAPALYDLGIDEGSAPAGAGMHKPVALAFNTAPALADTGMIWRVAGSDSPKIYTRSRWSVPPPDLVRQRLSERLARLGPVVPGDTVGLPRLQVTLMRFEQVFSADGAASNGQVALQAVLLRADGQLIAQKLVQRSVAAATQDAGGGVRALSRATDEAADDLARWLGGAMRQN